MPCHASSVGSVDGLYISLYCRIASCVAGEHSSSTSGSEGITGWDTLGLAALATDPLALGSLAGAGLFAGAGRAVVALARDAIFALAGGTVFALAGGVVFAGTGDVVFGGTGDVVFAGAGDTAFAAFAGAGDPILDVVKWLVSLLVAVTLVVQQVWPWPWPLVGWTLDPLSWCGVARDLHECDRVRAVWAAWTQNFSHPPERQRPTGQRCVA